MTGGRELRFYHDFASPFSYIASRRVETVADEAGATLVWHPMLLGAVFKAVGTPIVPIDEMPPAKRAHARLDMLRWAAFREVPFRFPSRFPMRTVLPLRVALAAEAGRPEHGLVMTHRIYRAYWVEDLDISSPEVLLALAEDCGIEGEPLLRRAGEPEIKARLRERTDAAVAAGVFGAPSFQIDGGDVIWGQDRLELLRWLLQRDRPPG